jgi:hypothetical protein
MQNREELRQKGHNRGRKTTCRKRGENIIFRREGGNKYCFWTKILTPTFTFHVCLHFIYLHTDKTTEWKVKISWTLRFRIARAGIFPRSSLLGAGQSGLWEFGEGGSVG